MKNPKVSILCLTYNHEKYIKQALDSFLMQKTNFDFEVLIHDDASTDKTPQIIKEYQKKYPKIIKPIFSKYNKYSKGIRGILIKYLLPKAKGKYIALCEGDDYWTDPNKLQIQADFLDKNPKYTICFHKTRWFWENKEEKDRICPDYFQIKEYNLENLLKGSFMSTSSIFVRKLNYENISKANLAMGDWYFSLYHAKSGSIGFIPKVMSARRKHDKGIWWDFLVDPIKLVKNNGLYMMTMHNEVLKLFGKNPNFRKIIFSNINHLLNQIIEADELYNINLLIKVEKKFYKITREIIKYIDHNDFLFKKIIEVKKLKILFFSHSCQLGGSERSLLELIDELLEKDVMIMVVLPSDGPLKKLLDERPVITEIANYCWWGRGENVTEETKLNENTNSFSSLFDLLPKIEAFDPDVIYTNTVSIPWGAITAMLLNKPHIWHIREYGKIDHNLFFDLGEEETKKFINFTSNAVITNSKSVKDFYKDFVDEKKITVAYNYIHIPKELLKEKLKEKIFKYKNSTKLLLLGTIMPSKGQMDAVLATDILIEKKYKVELAIVGAVASKEYLEKIKKYIQEKNLEKNIYIKEFTENPYPIIKSANIVLTCSKNEAFGRGTVEAMLLKKPVIGTGSGGTLELIKDGYNGFLYQSENFIELAEKIESLIKNKDKIKQLGENGYQFIKKNITKENYGGKIYQILNMIKNQQPIFKKYQLLTKPFTLVYQNKLTTLTTQNTQLNQQLSQKNQEIENYKNQIAQIQNQLNQTVSLIEVVKKENERKNQEITQLRFQVDKTLELIEIVKKENERKNRKIKTLESKIRQIEEEKREKEEEERKKAEELEKENESIRQQIQQTKIHTQNLENTLNMIKSAKFFKLWQGYCKIRDNIKKLFS